MIETLTTARIKNFSNYEINTKGEVFNITTGRKLKPSKVGGKVGDYYNVGMQENKQTHRRYIHRLVYETFVGELKKGFVIDHINNNKLDNRFINLQQIKQRINTTKDRFRGNYTSNFLGVCKYTNNKGDYYRTMIQINGKNRWIGNYTTDFAAACKYYVALENVDKFINNKQFRDLVNSQI
jgi:hypothetical protein